ncbi:MAG: acyltransferase [Firmicutes bacterium]|nr:acyltransferase [Bacillota bacterium]
MQKVAAPQKKNYVELEIIRTLSFIAVFTQHVLGAAARRNEGLLPIKMEWLIAFLFELSRFAVPAFVFMFGLLMVLTYKENTRYTAFLKKRFKLIYVPYILATAFYMAFDLYRYKEDFVVVSMLKSFMEKLLLGNGFYHLWYVAMIFQFVILAPVVFAAIRLVRSDKFSRKKLLGLMTSLIILSLIYLYVTPKLDLPVFFKTYYTRLFPTWLFFFISGAVCGLNYERAKLLIKRFFPITMILSIAAMGFAFYKDVVYIGINQMVHFNQVSFLEPVYAVLTLMEIFALIALADYIKSIRLISKTSGMIGAHSYMAYLVHAYVISVVSLQLAGLLPGLNLYIFYLILYPVALVITLVISVMVDKIVKRFSYN